MNSNSSNNGEQCKRMMIESIIHMNIGHTNGNMQLKSLLILRFKRGKSSSSHSLFAMRISHLKKRYSIYGIHIYFHFVSICTTLQFRLTRAFFMINFSAYCIGFNLGEDHNVFNAMFEAQVLA